MSTLSRRPAAAPSLSPQARRHAERGPAGWLWLVGVVVVVVAAAHTLVVSARYHVGSFDDDAGYLLAARALASGAGLTSTLVAGSPLVAAYPPGYPAMLAPLTWLPGNGFGLFRALSVAFFLAIFPLTWAYLARRGIPRPVRLSVLVLLALSPMLATYGTMVMAEAPFVVVVLVLLLVVERWQLDRATLTWAGAGTIAGAAALLWLKEAGAGLVLGLVAWLVLRRWWRKAAMLVAATAALFAPVLIARAAANVPLVGSRYSDDLGGYYTGGVLNRLTHVAPHAIATYAYTALPWSIVPTAVSPLPMHGFVQSLLTALRWTAVPLMILGLVVSVRRHRDAACVMVPVYLLLTLGYPFINERRVILVLPVVVAWYVIGAWAVKDAIASVAARSIAGMVTRPPVRAAGTALAVMASLLVLLPLVVQFPRDYLYGPGQDSSAPGGSRYMSFLRALGRPGDVVETDYLWTTALFSGHRTANRAYLAPCDQRAITEALGQDDAGFLLSAALNKPGLVGAYCLLPLVGSRPSLVRLYRTARDDASVFELIGPGTGHPGLRDLTGGAHLAASTSIPALLPEIPQTPGDPAGSYTTIESAGGAASVTWVWDRPGQVVQMSLGAAGAAGATGVAGSADRAAALGPAPVATSVVMALRQPDGTWRQMAAAPGPVGDGAPTPYLLVRFPRPVAATAVRVTVGGSGAMAIHDLHVLGDRP